jgi:flagellar biosynthesis/type III secretory pathway M-ring protein FliF/YscJ
MTQKEKIQGEIERTLQSIDGVKRAEANPFLYTRIQARMNKKSTGWEGIFSFVSKPAIAIAIVAIVMAVNGWALWGSNTTEETITESSNASELATEYNSVASVNNYDYENITSE